MCYQNVFASFSNFVFFNFPTYLSYMSPLSFLWYLPSAVIISEQLSILLLIEATCWSLGSFSRRSLQSLRIVSCDPSVSVLHHSFALSGCGSSELHFSAHIKQWHLKLNVTTLSLREMVFCDSGMSFGDLFFKSFFSMMNGYTYILVYLHFFHL